MRISLFLFFFLNCFGLDWQKEFSLVETKRDNPKEVAYNLLHQAIKDGTVDELKSNLEDYFKTKITFNKAKIFGIAQLINTYKMLFLFESLKLDIKKEPLFVKWLSQRDTFFKIIVNLEKEDKILNVFSLAKKLVEHNYKGAMKYPDLVCAIALVQDQKHRLIHHQMGKVIPVPEKNVMVYYDYFYDLYESGKNKIPYRNLSIRELIFVVSVPVPVSELKWAREYVRGKSKTWGDRYSDIVYSHQRINKKRYNWDLGLYTLESIQQNGGICVDQAYYGVISARSWGIPAIYFSGRGKRGGHAWFGYSLDGRKWFLDAGRYSSDNYTTGKGNNPQTQVKMKDHQLNLFLGGIGQEKKETISKQIFSICNGLKGFEQNNLIEKYLLYSFEKYSFYEKNWQLWLDIYKDDLPKQAYVLNKKLIAYRKYLDVYITDANKLIGIYTKLNDPDNIKKIEIRLKTIVRKRDDLSLTVAYHKAVRYYQEGRNNYARRGFEHAIKTNIKEQGKILDSFINYLNLTFTHDETKEALRFTSTLSKKIKDKEFYSLILNLAQKHHQKSLAKK